MRTIPIPTTIGSPAYRALTQNGYTNLNQLANIKEIELLQLHGVGPKAIKILKSAFKENNIKAAML